MWLNCRLTVIKHVEVILVFLDGVMKYNLLDKTFP